ncbi:MAG: methylmalonyl-CoA mutase small subunit [Actinobacteria bacterium HGW-Actinobacteria-2]|nr:MAG: methylmalonyl-CoA mutase small subunit [Actinobacteria bacterium HGW-Actinobacteria-2]
MTETPLLLAGDFDAGTAANWDAEVLKVFNRRRPAGKELTIDQAMARLHTTTVDGLEIEPLYTGPAAPLGHPGVMPFTRGTTVKTGDATAWDLRQLHEDPDVAFTHAEVLADLERGGTSVWLRLGADAIAPGDLAAVLSGVDPTIAGVSVSSHDDPRAAAAALVAFFKQFDPALVRGNLGFDPLALSARTGEAPDLSCCPEWVGAVLNELPRVRALTVDVTGYDEAGASDVDQLAFALATGVAYLRNLEAAGISTVDAFSQIVFRVSVNADQFTSIARLRALRRAWSRIGEASGVPAAERGAVQHAVTSWRMITRDDPWVNLLRTTIATFAAAVGGAEIITTLPFDTALGLPDDFSRRMARNIQLVAAEESNIGRVNDPAGGSWYVESLTEQLAAKAWTVFTEIEAAGGMVEALTGGLIADRIAATNAARAKLLATRKLPLTGVSMFPKPDEERRVTRPRPAAPARAGLVPVRDSAAFEALRDRAAAASTPPQVFLACLGERRDFGGREMFTKALLGVAGIATPGSEGGTAAEIAAQAAGAKFAILCSAAAVYAEQAIEVATALKEAGVKTVFIAGRKAETGAENVDAVIDGEVFDGMDVVAFLNATLDQIGGAE